MIGSVINVFRIPELRTKILFTVAILVVFRLGAYVPIPGTSAEYLGQIAGADAFGDGGEGSGGGLQGYLSFIARITGGSYEPFLFSLGIMPYISASIILQLLTQAIPSLEKLAKEGEAGRRKITEYTRYLTVALCLVQATIIAKTGAFPGGWRGDVSPVLYYFVCATAMTAGTVFLMWLGELVDEFGIGNGISLIIMAGIVDRLPAVALYLGQNATLEFMSFRGTAKVGIETVFVMVLMFIGVIIGVVAMTQAQRRIPIQQAKHTRGRRVYGGQRQYLPLRINQAGVIPVIFASSLLMLPMYLFQWIARTWQNDVTMELASAFGYGQIPYLLVYVGLIYLFCYFWTSIQFRPSEMADNLRNYGSFIPGRRPGPSTATYLERVMNRITFVGAGFLAIVAILPLVISQVTNVPMLLTGFMGGTGLLIIVSVALDLVQRIESHLIMRHYEGFLSEGRVRGRR